MNNTCSATKGAQSELIVCGDLLKRGFAVYRSVSPAAPCDVVAVDGEGRMMRVEVRSARHRKDGTVKVNGVYNAAKYDIFAAVLPNDSIVYRPRLDGNEPLPYHLFSKQREAELWLRRLLTEQAYSVKALEERGESAGFSRRTLYRAAHALGVRMRPLPNPDGRRGAAGWWWSLPSGDHTMPRGRYTTEGGRRDERLRTTD